MRTIVIVTGLTEEADAFLPGRGSHHEVGSLSVRSVETAGATIHLACAGIGKVAAATAASLLATRFEADMLMVIGTAGALGPTGGEPHWLSAAVQHDYGAARPDRFAHYDAGKWPMGPEGATAFRSVPQPVGLGLAEATIASGDCFIECGARAGTIRDALGASFVDMETAAVAHAATILGLPWCAIKAATDEANLDSAGDFSANLASAANRAALAAAQAIRLMAGQSQSV